MFITSGSYFASFCVIQKLFTYILSEKARTAVPPLTSSMATAKHGDHSWTYLFLTRAIGATLWQKALICRCHCLRCHTHSGSHSSHGPTSPIVSRGQTGRVWPRETTSPMATSMSVSARVSARVPPQCRHILQKHMVC